VLGPVYDTIVNAEKILLNEVNSANDNPIIDHKNENVYHGGNFHGDYVSFEMDKLKIAVAKMCMMCERQLNYLLNDKLNGKLPPFVNLGKLGLNFGMQGIQFTATSTTAENQTLAFPMYLHSIPNNNDNQDIVSMGTNSALITKKVVENTAEVLAIEFMTILQAVDYLGFESKLSPVTQKVFRSLRKTAPKFTDDKPRNEELTRLKNLILDESPLKNVFA
jgi:histidine ammonia-lyase